MEGKEKLVVSRPAIYIAAEGMGNSPMCGMITHLMIDHGCTVFFKYFNDFIYSTGPSNIVFSFLSVLL